MHRLLNLKFLSLPSAAILFCLCAGCQSSDAGVQALCDAPSTCGEACANASPAMRMQVLARHIESEVSNSDVQAQFQQMGALEPAARLEALNSLAAQAHVSPCALTQVFAVAVDESDELSPEE